MVHLVLMTPLSPGHSVKQWRWEYLTYIYNSDSGCTPVEERNSKLLFELFRRHPAASAPSRMHHGFRRRTKPTIWYMSLLALRAVAYVAYGKPAHEDIIFLERSWIEWGGKAGIDEQSAKLLYDGERNRMCHNESCPRGRILHDRLLLVCRGCGQARYCDRVCQKQGWKEGHRESCRRLPAP
ncbi:hypothetical protein PENSPDRAFT_195909 [Peniophora sp. CONT]|nr:hypothetical protein PENSPDRAFT_195909 [Peniophora sp. CONT]